MNLKKIWFNYEATFILIIMSTSQIIDFDVVTILIKLFSVTWLSLKSDFIIIHYLSNHCKQRSLTRNVGVKIFTGIERLTMKLLESTRAAELFEILWAQFKAYVTCLDQEKYYHRHLFVNFYELFDNHEYNVQVNTCVWLYAEFY